MRNLPQPSGPAPANIAIIDNHYALAETISYALQSELKQFNVVAISNIAHAVPRLLELQPVVAIVDWRFGLEAGGVELSTGSQLIKATSARLPNTRWILFTAYITQYVLKDAIAAGIRGCVSKGANYKDLVAAIIDVMDGKAHFCQESQVALAQVATPLNLTATECDILRAIATGKEPKEIADCIGLSLKTVYNHLIMIRQKLGVTSMVDLAKVAINHGIAPPHA